MTQFDPYHAWLGIPPDEQPPTHYRLLGLQWGESNEDVISDAADRQSAHLKTKQHGAYSGDSQRLLNEVARARVCLLNPTARAEYDRSAVLPMTIVSPPPKASLRPRSMPAKNPVMELVKVVGGGVIGIIIAGFVVRTLTSRVDTPNKQRSARQVAVSRDTVRRQTPATASPPAEPIAEAPDESQEPESRPSVPDANSTDKAPGAPTPLKTEQDAISKVTKQPVVPAPRIPGSSAPTGKVTEASPPNPATPAPSPSPPVATARLLKIYNTHNAFGNDRGARKVNVVLKVAGAEVWRKDRIETRWLPGREALTVLPLPSDVAFDTLRIEITEWVPPGCGLSEVEVYNDDNVNIATLGSVVASSFYKSPTKTRKSDFSTPRLIDGVTRSNQWGVGYWLAKNNVESWIEIKMTGLH